ncbi:MAG: GTPase RsgA [Coriobacteriales bacterium]|jgi:ribosome biogenesis GTPase|nr:GTPase RsgA [Coriobacteriales bacterium]
MAGAEKIDAGGSPAVARSTGRVISLDRGFPLVGTAAGELRAQHSIDLVKGLDVRAVVGDVVDLEFPPGQDVPLIVAIHPRRHTLVRRTLVESRHEGAGKYEEQVLATNIDLVLVVSALSNRPLDTSYLERQLVLAHESGAQVALILTKADLARHLEGDCARARAVAAGSPVIVESAVTGEGLERIRALLTGGKVGVLLGRSGVGKSTLVNALLEESLLATAAVRQKDRAGRHTTVGRRMVFLPHGDEKGGGSAPGVPLAPAPLPAPSAPGAQGIPAPAPSALIDTPGLRSLGLYDAHVGLAAAFPDIVAHAAACRYRDCTHTGEPGCAVAAAVEAGTLPADRLSSYIHIFAEVND